MATHKKRSYIWLLILAAIGLCGFAIFKYGRYSVIHEKEPAWSPDGRYIAFACEPRFKFVDINQYFGLDWLDWPFYEDVYTICIKDTTTNKLTWLTNSFELHTPSWSPDGNNLAWRKGCNSYVVWNLATKKQFDVKVSEIDCFQEDIPPAWSKDSNRIFIQGSSVGIDVQTQSLISLGASSSYIISPSGTYLASVENDYLIVRETDTQNIIIKLENPSFLLTDLRWNPDGTILAWMPMGRYDFALTSVETRETVYFADLGLGYLNISSWSPNGDKIALFNQLENSDDFELTVLKITCSSNPFGCKLLERKQYNLKGYAPSHLTWSPDGKQIAYQTHYTYGTIRIIDLETGQDYLLIERNE